MSGTASRYQNSLIYDPSLYVGRYPERSANTLPRAVLGSSSTRPMVFDPVPELVMGTAPSLPVSAGGAAGGGLGGLGAAGGAGLAGMLSTPLVKGAARGIEELARLSGGTPLPGVTVAPPGGGEGLTIAPPEYQGIGTLDPLGVPDGTLGGAMAGAGGWLGSQGLTIAPGFSSGGSLLAGSAGDGASLLGGVTPQPWGDLSIMQGGTAELGSTVGQIPGQAGGAFGSFDTGLGFNINPLNIGAGMIGGMAGNALGTSAFGPGDPDQRPWTSGIGSAAGGLAGGALAGAAAGSVVPVIGTLIGALAGAFLGSAVGGEPDYPIGYFGGYADYGDSGPQFRTGNPGETNGGDAGAAGGMSNALGAILAQRAAADGYTVAPQYVNQQLFNAGLRNDGKNDPFFYNAGTAVPAAADNPMWRGTSFDQLANFAYGDLVGRGVFAAPGTGPAWGDVQANLREQGDLAGGWGYNGGADSLDFTNPLAWNQRTYVAPGSQVGALPELGAGVG